MPGSYRPGKRPPAAGEHGTQSDEIPDPQLKCWNIKGQQIGKCPQSLSSPKELSNHCRHFTFSLWPSSAEFMAVLRAELIRTLRALQSRIGVIPKPLRVHHHAQLPHKPCRRRHKHQGAGKKPPIKISGENIIRWSQLKILAHPPWMFM